MMEMNAYFRGVCWKLELFLLGLGAASPTTSWSFLGWFSSGLERAACSCSQEGVEMCRGLGLLGEEQGWSTRSTGWVEVWRIPLCGHQKRILKVSKGLFVQRGSLTLPRSTGMDCVGGNMLKHPFICIKITCGHFSFAPSMKIFPLCTWIKDTCVHSLSSWGSVALLTLGRRRSGKKLPLSQDSYML